jgi:chromosome segregation ATPase
MELQNAKKQLKNVNNAINAQNLFLENLKNETSKIEIIYFEKKSNLDSLERKYKDKVADQELQLKNIKETFHNEINKKNKELEKIEAKILVLKREKDSFNINTLKIEQDTLKKQIKEEKEKLQEIKSDFLQNVLELDRILIDKHTAIKLIEEKRQEFNSLKEDIKIQEKAIQEIELKNKQLFENDKKLKKEMQKDIKKLRNQKEFLKNKINNLKNNLKEIRKDIEKAVQEKNEKNNEIQNLMLTFETLEKREKAVNSKENQLKKRYAKLNLPY